MRVTSIALFALCALAPLTAQAQSDCVKRPLLHEPTSITPLERENYTAYVNDAVPPDQTQELHLVGSYNGSGRIVIGPTPKPVVLVLGSYLPSIWRLELAPGARLSRVILLGRDTQRVTGVPAGVEIMDRSACGDWASGWEGARENVRYMTDQYRSFLAAAQHASGLAESSFQSDFSRIDAVVTVPPSRSDVRPATTISQPARVRDLLVPDRQATIARYETLMAQAPAEFQPTMKILIDLMKRDKFPILFPSGAPGREQGAPVGIRLLFEQPANRAAALNRGDCNNYFVLGRADGGSIHCATGNQFYVLGNANDVLDDSWGDDIVSPGGGDDVLHLHWGNDIMVLGENWGDKIITKTCHDASLSAADRERLHWPYRYSNFIVFGAGIRPQDMRWDSKTVLTHGPSNSKLTIKDECFTFVFAEDGDLAPMSSRCRHGRRRRRPRHHRPPPRPTPHSKPRGCSRCASRSSRTWRSGPRATSCWKWTAPPTKRWTRAHRLAGETAASPASSATATSSCWCSSPPPRSVCSKSAPRHPSRRWRTARGPVSVSLSPGENTCLTPSSSCTAPGMAAGAGGAFRTCWNGRATRFSRRRSPAWASEPICCVKAPI